MVICGVRQIELHRLTVGDIIRRSDGKVGLRVYAKRSERRIPLQQDLVELLDRYLSVRKSTDGKLKKSDPIFISLASNYYGKPLSRRAMQLIATHYLDLVQNNSEEFQRKVTTHGLRHTVGYLMTVAGHSLRVIQDYLGHADPRTTAIYAHIVNLWENNPTVAMNLVV